MERGRDMIAGGAAFFAQSSFDLNQLVPSSSSSSSIHKLLAANEWEFPWTAILPQRSDRAGGFQSDQEEEEGM